MPVLRILQVGLAEELARRAESIEAQGPTQEASGPRGSSDLNLSSDAVNDLPAAQRWLAAAGAPPQLVVLFQSRPGQFSQADLESLRARAPLARLWRVLGPWCEGETRSGHPPTGCTSLHWHQWPARLERELRAAQAGLLPEWSLPVTASSEERTLALAERPLPQGQFPDAGRISVAIVAQHAATAAALADVVKLGGYEPNIIAGGAELRSSATVALLWNAHAGELCNPQAVAAVKGVAPGAALIALVTFPRPSDARRAAELGVAAIVAKPYLVADLLESICRAAEGAVPVGQVNDLTSSEGW